jgi:hypothetical protein
VADCTASTPEQETATFNASAEECWERRCSNYGCEKFTGREILQRVHYNVHASASASATVKPEIFDPPSRAEKPKTGSGNATGQALPAPAQFLRDRRI